MSPRSLFNVILKIIGIFFIKEIIDSAQKLVIDFLYFLKVLNGGSEAGPGLIFLLMIVVVYATFAYLFIFKSNMIIDKLKLTDDFEHEDFSMVIAPSVLLKLALIVASAFLLITEIPNLMGLLFSYFQQSQVGSFGQSQLLAYCLTSAAKIVIALLLIGERKRIIEFVEERFGIKPTGDESE